MQPKRKLKKKKILEPVGINQPIGRPKENSGYAEDAPTQRQVQKNQKTVQKKKK